MSRTLEQLLKSSLLDMKLDFTEESQKIVRAANKVTASSKKTILPMTTSLLGGLSSFVSGGDDISGALRNLLAKGKREILGNDMEKAMDELLAPLKPQNISNDVAKVVTELPPGTPVYCNLAVMVEHTGIALGDGTIAQLNGSGLIEKVSATSFVERLDGLNPARIIRYPRTLCGGKILHSEKAAQRAIKKLGTRRDYNVILDNCHQFTYGCLSGRFENSKNFFHLFNDGVREQFGENFEWCIWDYFDC